MIDLPPYRRGGREGSSEGSSEESSILFESKDVVTGNVVKWVGKSRQGDHGGTDKVIDS